MQRRRELSNEALEHVAEVVHDAWMRLRRAAGYHGPREACADCPTVLGSGQCRYVHPDVVPYAALDEKTKEYDRATVRAVVDALAE